MNSSRRNFYGVLQVEPTDFCNLVCAMCHPQQGNRSVLHGDLLKGYMDFDLFRRIIDGIARGNATFDHLIFQWLGDPSLHPQLIDMLGYALDHVRDRFKYFRIDTNAIILNPDRVDQLMEVYARYPLKPVLIVFSLDAITRRTYIKVKGRDAFDVVMANVQYFLERRGQLDLDCINLNAEFQFVLQKGNFREARQFVQYWDEFCSQGRNGVGYNDIMVKRLSVGTGGEAQAAADQLYEDTLHHFDLRPFDKPHIHLKTWSQRPWEQWDELEKPTEQLDFLSQFQEPEEEEPIELLDRSAFEAEGLGAAR